MFALSLTQGVMERDRLVFTEVRKNRGKPIFMLTSGGYQVCTEYTLYIQTGVTSASAYAIRAHKLWHIYKCIIIHTYNNSEVYTCIQPGEKSNPCRQCLFAHNTHYPALVALLLDDSLEVSCFWNSIFPAAKQCESDSGLYTCPPSPAAHLKPTGGLSRHH